MTNEIKAIKKNGEVTFTVNEVIINYNIGSDSILFDDIISMSHKSFNYFKGSCALVSLVIGFLLLLFNFDQLSILIVLIGIILTFSIREKYDCIVIETTDDKLVSFRVDYGMGQFIIDKIESERRNKVSF